MAIPSHIWQRLWVHQTRLSKNVSWRLWNQKETNNSQKPTSKCYSGKNPPGHSQYYLDIQTRKSYLDEDDIWKGVLSATAFAVRSTYHTTLKKSLGQLVFERDMIFNIKHVANWEFIRENKKKLIDKTTKQRIIKKLNTPSN